ncbi:putative serine/threonine-protein kinase, partial [Sesbania bispinosa]
MAEIPESTVIPPLTLEQRMERLEGNFGQILGLLKTLIPNKEIANDNSNNNDNGGG